MFDRHSGNVVQVGARCRQEAGVVIGALRVRLPQSRGLWNRQLASYPDGARRLLYLGIAVLARVTLFYELYIQGAVHTRDRERGRRVRLHGRRAGRSVGPREPCCRRAPAERPADRRCDAQCIEQAAVHGGLRTRQQRRGRCPGGHAGAGARLLPAAPPRRGDGVLDDGGRSREPGVSITARRVICGRAGGLERPQRDPDRGAQAVAQRESPAYCRGGRP
jgi:hypothetical protein